MPSPNHDRPASDAAVHAAALDQTHAIVQDFEGTILQWTSGAEALYGWTCEEALGRNSHELLDVSLPDPLEEIRSVLFTTGSWTGEFRQRRRDGSVIWVVGHWSLLRDDAGEPVAVIKMNNDITALKTAEATTRSLFENAPPGILTADPAGRIVNVNATALGLFGYTREEMTGSPVEMLLPEAMREAHVGHRAGYAMRPHARPMGQGLDLVARRKDGTEFPVEISLGFVAEHQGGGLVIAFVSDISARKQLERERENLISKLERALAEKTVLLKEVHHRVKNNMAVIAGLLGMQADTMLDTRAAVALAESQQRVESMALIHEFLYSAEHLDRVNFGRYIEQLAQEVFSVYALEPDLVSLVIEAEEIDLGLHRAIPCGLILNELFSNALKYAFPRGGRGTIRVRFFRLKSGDLTLSVEDDGVGIPADFDWETVESVGLRVVRILARQIDGVLTLGRRIGGTKFEMRFPPHSPTALSPTGKVETWSGQGGSGPSHSLLRSASASL
jgi:PAS domain S-box-containing protein